MMDRIVSDENYLGAVMGHVLRNSPSRELLDMKYGKGTTDSLLSMGLIEPKLGCEIRAWKLNGAGAETLDLLRTKWRRLLRETEARK